MIPKILLVEDDKDLQESLRELLIDNHYSIKQVFTGAKALKSIEIQRPDLVILDLGLPDISGETVCKEIKKIFPDLPIIILTARGTTEDIVHGFNIGADDYVSKPFEIEELLVRIKTRLKDHKKNGILKIADLELDTEKIEVRRNGKQIILTPKEFILLEYLMKNKGQVLSRDMILDRVWSYPSEVESRVIDVYIGYLRKKIDKNAVKKLIHSIKGFGYTIKE